MTDESIVDKFWERSEDAIKNTSEKYGAYLLTISMNILHLSEDAEECVNDTYYTAWNQIPPDRPRKLLPYLGRITRCLSLNRFDRLRAQKRSSDFTVQLTELEDCLSHADDTASEFESSALSATISDFLRSLDRDKRNMFIRRYWFSDNISEIAKRFEISESKVKSILFRIRKQLKRYLEREGYTV